MRFIAIPIPLALAILLVSCSPKSEPPKSAEQTIAAAPLAPQPEFKAQSLPAEEEKRIIDAAKAQKTDDGATVIQVLEHAQKMRPKEFKLAGFEMFYSSAGLPSSVGVCYWIGSKRLDDDKFCDVGYDLLTDHKSFKPSVGSAGPEDQRELTVSKVQRGRDVFLEEVDKRYDAECVDVATKKKSC